MLHTHLHRVVLLALSAACCAHFPLWYYALRSFRTSEMLWPAPRHPLHSTKAALLVCTRICAFAHELSTQFMGTMRESSMTTKERRRQGSSLFADVQSLCLLMFGFSCGIQRYAQRMVSRWLSWRPSAPGWTGMSRPSRTSWRASRWRSSACRYPRPSVVDSILAPLLWTVSSPLCSGQSPHPSVLDSRECCVVA